MRYSSRNRLHACRSLIVSEQNLRLLGTTYSYRDYEIFFEKQIEPVEISKRPLLEEPEVIIQEADETGEDDEGKKDQEPTPQNQEPTDDPIFNNNPVKQQNDFPDFDEDFW